MLSVLKSHVAELFETSRRVLVVLALCVWFGGFTFYSLVVIHMGHKVFESLVEVGFLTQAVTRWLNLIGVGTLCLMLWNVFAGWSRQKRFIRGTLLSTWLLAAGIELALFVLHPMLDAHLDPETRSLVARPEFVRLHLLYVNLSTTQWVATIVYICATVKAWTPDPGRTDQSWQDLPTAGPATREFHELAIISTTDPATRD
jgi:hypothetical protein